jgi:hypothetical protein
VQGLRGKKLVPNHWFADHAIWYPLARGDIDCVRGITPPPDESTSVGGHAGRAALETPTVPDPLEAQKAVMASLMALGYPEAQAANAAQGTAFALTTVKRAKRKRGTDGGAAESTAQAPKKG